MPQAPKQAMSPFDDDAPTHERYDPHDPADAPLDSEVDFDDEADEDQLPLDQVEAIELGVNLDDPERIVKD